MYVYMYVCMYDMYVYMTCMYVYMCMYDMYVYDSGNFYLGQV